MDHCRDSNHVLAVGIGQGLNDRLLIAFGWIFEIGRVGGNRRDQAIARQVLQDDPGLLDVDPQPPGNALGGPLLGRLPA